MGGSSALPPGHSVSSELGFPSALSPPQRPGLLLTEGDLWPRGLHQLPGRLPSPTAPGRQEVGAPCLLGTAREAQVPEVHSGPPVCLCITP